MSEYQTIFVIHQESGKIEERFLIARKNGRCFTLSNEQISNGRTREQAFPECWCFDTLEEAERFIEDYSLQMKKQVHTLDVLQDMFNAWADEYSDEKDFVQKKALANFLKEEIGINVIVNQKCKLHHWEYDAVEFRKSQPMA